MFSELEQFSRLLWQPGKTLHHDWWNRLGLASWEVVYPRLTGSTMRELNRVITLRRCFPDEQFHLTGEFNGLQRALLRSFERLPMLMTAFGLLLSACPDYLLLKPWRTEIARQLSETQLQQVWCLWRSGLRTPDIAPENIVQHLQQLGIASLQRSLHDDPVWRALSYTLPEPRGIEPPEKGATELFMRLERFL